MKDHIVKANVGDVVHIHWTDADGRTFIREHTAPPKATQEAVFRVVGKPEIDVPKTEKP